MLLPARTSRRLVALLAGGVFVSLLLAAGSSLRAQTYTFTNIASGYPASGVAVDGGGTLYFTWSNTVQKRLPNGSFVVVAGTGQSGSVNATGTAARFNSPRGIALGPGGEIFVADMFNHTIRKIAADGAVTTVAGLAGTGGAVDGSVTDARFYTPAGIAIDGGGNLFVADMGSETIRKITPAGAVTTIAGVAFQAGTADGNGVAARFNQPQGIAVDTAGNVYVADTNNHAIRKISATGAVSTLAGFPGNLGSADGAAGFAQFNKPSALAIDSTGSLFVADTLNGTIRRITPSGAVATIGGVAGQGGEVNGTGSTARFSFTRGLVVDNLGTLYVADNYSLRLGTPSSQPAITVHPQPASVAAGANFSLNATATGVSPLNYQWQKNGTPIPGATGPSLTFPNVQSSDSGTFSVSATNPVGIVTSTGAGLSVVAALPNNNFVDAQALTGATGSATGRNNGATSELGEPTHSTAVATASSVWYRWTAPQTGRAIFDFASSFAVGVGIYTGSSLPTLVPVTRASGSRITFNAVAGTTYSIAVGSNTGSVGNFTVNWRVLLNDNFADAEAINGAAGQVSGTTNGASGEPGEPVHFPSSSGSTTSVWYRWTPTQNTVATFTTVGSEINTVLAAYTGNSISNLVRVVQDFSSGTNGRSRIVFPATANTTYYIVVGGYYGTGGNILLNWETSQTPVIVSQPRIFLTQSAATTAASLSVAVGTGVTIQVSAASFLSSSVQWLRNGTAIPGATNATLLVPNAQVSDAGTFTAVISNSAGSVTTNSAVLIVFAPPANDHFASAQTITGLTGTVTGGNVNATGEPNEPAHWNIAGATSSVWYKWTPGSSGLAVVDTVGSNYDTVLAVYTGTALTSLTRLVQDDDRGGGRTSQVSFAASAGTTYSIAIGGSTSTARGNIQLNWQLTPVLSITTQPVGQTVAAGGSVTFMVAASGAAPAYQWNRNGVAIPGATNATLTVGSIQAGSDASYTATVTSGGATATSSPATLSVASPLLSSFSVRRTRAEGDLLWSAASGDGQLVAVGNPGVILSSSDNGRTWTQRASGNTAWLVAVTYGNGQFVVVGEGGRILLSSDGITWTPVTATGTTERLNNVIYADGKYVAVGEHGTVVTSVDARVWTLRSTPVNTWLHGLAYHAGIRHFVACGEGAVFLYSPDAVTWSRLPIPNYTGALQHTVAVDSYSHFVAVGEQGKVISVRQNQLVLKDGQSLTTWTGEANPTNTTSHLIGLVQAAGALFATSDDGQVITAANDRGPWFSLRSGTTGYLLAGVYHNNRLYVVGEQETIIESDPIYSTRLINISTRGQVGTGGEVLISGFIVTGTSSKQILIRAAGPALTGFGVSGQLAAPVLTLFDRSGQPIAMNAGWNNATNSAAISTAATAVGAFPFAANSADSAMLITLEPGNYTAQISGANNTTGVAIVEAYDTEPLSVETSRAINVSTRGLVGGGQGKMIAGFVIDGSSARRVLIRAVGPGLAAFGLPGTLPEPQLELYTSRGLLQGSASAWGLQPNADEIRGAAPLVSAFPLPEGSRDAAMLVTLLPGAWTVQVGGPAGATGVALVEVYVLP